MKKKLVVLGLALAMVLSFTACSSSGDSKATATPAGATTEAPVASDAGAGAASEAPADGGAASEAPTAE